MPFVTRAQVAEWKRAAAELEAHHRDTVSCDEAQTAAAKDAANLRVQVRGLTARVRGAEEWARRERAGAELAVRGRDDALKQLDAALGLVAVAEQRARLAVEHAEGLERQVAEAVAERAPTPAVMRAAPADERIAQLERAVEAADRDRDARDTETQRLAAALRELAEENERLRGLLAVQQRDPAWPSDRINNESTRGCEK